jgi:hypothetical protein
MAFRSKPLLKKSNEMGMPLTHVTTTSCGLCRKHAGRIAAETSLPESEAYPAATSPLFAINLNYASPRSRLLNKVAGAHPNGDALEGAKIIKERVE